jgi:hypothetical protein
VHPLTILLRWPHVWHRWRKRDWLRGLVCKQWMESCSAPLFEQRVVQSAVLHPNRGPCEVALARFNQVEDFAQHILRAAVIPLDRLVCRTSARMNWPTNVSCCGRGDSNYARLLTAKSDMTRMNAAAALWQDASSA